MGITEKRQVTLPENVRIPARSFETPQMEGLEQDPYVLERFDLPSDLTWVVSGMDTSNDLEGIRQRLCCINGFGSSGR